MSKITKILFVALASLFTVLPKPDGSDYRRHQQRHGNWWRPLPNRRLS